MNNSYEVANHLLFKYDILTVVRNHIEMKLLLQILIEMLMIKRLEKHLGSNSI